MKRRPSLLPSLSPRTQLNRRTVLWRSASAAAACAMGDWAPAISPPGAKGILVGEPTAENVAARIFASGGNAFDAIVAGGFAAAVAAPHQTGIGGYALTGIFAVDSGRRMVALDANTTAPAAMRGDTFKMDAKGGVPNRVNEFGWLAAGVPGVLAGLELALKSFGTRSLSEMLRPAISIAREGYKWPAPLATIVKNPQFSADPATRKLYSHNGTPLAAGDLFQNQELAEMLESLAKAGNAEAFYRGDIAQHIADAFQKNGGLVTAQDLAAYHARLVDPLSITWGEQTIHTPPLPAGGITFLQTLLCMQAMNWTAMPAGLQRTQARIEALRMAWRDRLTLLGDPDQVSVPQGMLLSPEYAKQCAEEVMSSVNAGKPIPHKVTSRDHGGTINLSAADEQGNFAAITLTHGNAFGARVTIAGLGLTLGHGMSRFDPTPGHPNAPGPGKRPLHNMCPSLISRGGKPICVVGGRGGRKIPNAMLEFLTHFVVLNQPLDSAIAAPRLHTEGATSLELEKHWPADEVASLNALGYVPKTGGSATLSAASLENGSLKPVMR
jgi:gamma-glutamyltranspeptidase/glutathione hydrolase